MAEAGRPLKPRTIQTALGELEAAGLAAGSEETMAGPRYWSSATLIPDDRDGGERRRACHDSTPVPVSIEASVDRAGRACLV